MVSGQDSAVVLIAALLPDAPRSSQWRPHAWMALVPDRHGVRKDVADHAIAALLHELPDAM
jgi:hypothetical protein